MEHKLYISDHVIEKYCIRVMGLDEDEITIRDKYIAFKSIKREFDLAIPIGHSDKKIKKQYGHMVYVFDTKKKRIVTVEKFY